MATCEICGRQTSRLSKVHVEGAILTVCEACRTLGEEVREEAEEPIRKAVDTRRVGVRRVGVRLAPPKAIVEESLGKMELVKNYGQVVKRAREGLALSHQELGLKISEKASVIQKVEAEKLVPDDALAGKLEHALKVKLLVTPSTPVVEVPKEVKPRVLTLGDVVKLKTRKAE